MSFTEGKSQHLLEISSTKIIPELENSNFLIQKLKIKLMMINMKFFTEYLIQIESKLII